MRGHPLYGRSAHGLAITIAPNAQSATHAEAEVPIGPEPGQNGEHVTMYVDRRLCRASGNDRVIANMLCATAPRPMKAVAPDGRFRIIAPDGRFRITADQPSVPVRIGDAI